LKDFICETVACEIGDFENPELVITLGKLCEHFEKALRKHEKAEAKKEKAKNEKVNEDEANEDETQAQTLSIPPPHLPPTTSQSETTPSLQTQSREPWNLWNGFGLWRSARSRGGTAG